MNFQDSKIVEYRIPESFTNEKAEAWEFYLYWKNKDGGEYCWLFTNFTVKNIVNGQIINEKSENIAKLLQSSTVTIDLAAEDLTLNQFQVFEKVKEAISIRRYYKNKSFINLQVTTKNSKYIQSDNRYNFFFTVQKQNNPIIR